MTPRDHSAGPDSSPTLFPGFFDEAPAPRRTRRPAARKARPQAQPAEARPSRAPETARFDDDAEQFDGLS